MTEPDEALLWAREQAKQLREAPNDPTRDLSAEIDAGKHDDELSDMAHAYRAGAAASAERIKALEAALKPLAQCEIPGEITSLPDDHGCRYYFTFGEIRTARSMLKDPDQ